MKKLNLELGSIKQILTKEQMKKIVGGYDGECLEVDLVSGVSCTYIEPPTIVGEEPPIQNYGCDTAPYCPNSPDHSAEGSSCQSELMLSHPNATVFNCG